MAVCHADASRQSQIGALGTREVAHEEIPVCILKNGAALNKQLLLQWKMCVDDAALKPISPCYPRMTSSGV